MPTSINQSHELYLYITFHRNQNAIQMVYKVTGRNVKQKKVINIDMNIKSNNNDNN